MMSRVDIHRRVHRPKPVTARDPLTIKVGVEIAAPLRLHPSMRRADTPPLRRVRMEASREDRLSVDSVHIFDQHFTTPHTRPRDPPTATSVLTTKGLLMEGIPYMQV